MRILSRLGWHHTDFTSSRLPRLSTSRAAKMQRDRRKASACFASPHQLASEAREWS